MITFFLSANAYAIDFNEGHKNTKKTCNTAHRVGLDEDNASSFDCVSTSIRLADWIIYLAGSDIGGNASLNEENDLPMSSRKGIYGLAVEGVTTMYKAQPTINVYAHLAEEWIPGYKDTAVYAADSGYQELTKVGIDQIWSATRNITYVFFIVIMIVVGFMIMFRSKIGGQTLVTLGNTLPNVILALIGVTFSFAIAGLIIDVGGLIMLILVDIFKNVGGFEELVTLNSVGEISNVLAPQALTGSLESFLGINLPNTSFLGLLGMGSLASIIGSVIPVIGGPSIATFLLMLILLIIGTVGVFMVFITLLKAYLGLLVNVIIGPFLIAISAIPGKQVSFINWIKSVFRNVLVYPISFAILNLPGLLYAVTTVDGELNLPGPDKLTLGSSGDSLANSDLVQLLGVMLFQILVLFIASKADKYAEVIVPPTTSKQAQQAALETKGAIGKIPLVGSLLVKK
jgi:hypothetical protein